MEMFAVDTAPTASSMRGGACSAAGHRRSLNEDAFVCGPTWFAVADGMGGHRAGDVASRSAIETLRRAPAPSSTDDIRELVAEANADIRSMAQRDGTHGMGTTLVAATSCGDSVAIANVGDSRCYRLADGDLTLVTHDHSHVQELIDLGRISADEAHVHRLRHVVTRAVGIDALVRPDIVVVPSPVGRLLLCSDGLTAELGPRTIGRVLAGLADPQAAAERLVELALRGAARDNVTAIVVDHLGATS